MSEADSFACPGCGAPLMSNGDAKEVKCPFCSTTVIVPENLRDDDSDLDSTDEEKVAKQAATPVQVVQAAGEKVEADLGQKQAEDARKKRTRRGKSLRVIGGIIGVIGILTLLLFVLAEVVDPMPNDTSGVIDAILCLAMPPIVLGAGLFVWGRSILRKLKVDNRGVLPTPSRY